jgi:uncharacterized membrane protein YphA (DoxX/SURF4 family)
VLPLSAQFTLIARLVLGGTLLISGTSKLRDPRAIVAGALAYRVLPPALVRPLARALPFVELLLGATLIGIVTRVAAVVTALMLGVFGAAVMSNLVRGRSIPCHCFGPSEHETIGIPTLARIAFLFVLAVAAANGPVEGSAGMTDVDLFRSISAAISVCSVLVLIGPMETVARGVVAVMSTPGRRFQVTPRRPEAASQ